VSKIVDIRKGQKIRALTNEDIAKRLFYSICTHDCLDAPIRDSILEQFEEDEELHELLCSIFDTVAERYFIEGYLMAKK